MSEVKVRFESDNFNKTVEYIRQYKLDDIDEEHRPNLEDYLQAEVKKLVEGDLGRWCKKDYGYFEHLCHHPIQGIACLYIIGDDPKVSVREFSVGVQNKGFQGNIVACLYTYLV
jgi:hypothetical protein